MVQDPVLVMVRDLLHVPEPKWIRLRRNNFIIEYTMAVSILAQSPEQAPFPAQALDVE